MRRSRTTFAARLALCLALIGFSGPGHAASLFMGAYPDSLVIFDDANGDLKERIPLGGLPRCMRASADKKTIFVMTITQSGVDVIDVASRKVTTSFNLNTPTTRYRINCGTPDPTGKLYYAVVTKINKEIDRYSVEKSRFAVIDLEKKAIVRMHDFEKEDEETFRDLRGGLEISEDGKYLYHFGDKVVILDTADFKVVERIQLAKPDLPGFEGVRFGEAMEAMRQPGEYVSLFNAEDPLVHNRVFGVARFDLDARKFTFTPIGPSPAAMTGLHIAPNKRDAYAVINTGTLGNKRCEFWHFDLRTNGVRQKREFDCKSRFSFGISLDGRKLYIYGASYDLEVYNANTLAHERTWDLQNDITGAGYVAVN